MRLHLGSPSTFHHIRILAKSAFTANGYALSIRSVADVFYENWSAQNVGFYQCDESLVRIATSIDKVACTPIPAQRAYNERVKTHTTNPQRPKSSNLNGDFLQSTIPLAYFDYICPVATDYAWRHTHGRVTWTMKHKEYDRSIDSALDAQLLRQRQTTCVPFPISYGQPCSSQFNPKRPVRSSSSRGP